MEHVSGYQTNPEHRARPTDMPWSVPSRLQSHQSARSISYKLTCTVLVTRHIEAHARDSTQRLPQVPWLNITLQTLRVRSASATDSPTHSFLAPLRTGYLHIDTCFYAWFSCRFLRPPDSYQRHSRMSSMNVARQCLRWHLKSSRMLKAPTNCLHTLSALQWLKDLREPHSTGEDKYKPKVWSGEAHSA